MNGILLTSEEYSEVIVALCSLAGMCEVASNNTSEKVSDHYASATRRWDALLVRIGGRISRKYKEV